MARQVNSRKAVSSSFARLRTVNERPFDLPRPLQEAVDQALEECFAKTYVTDELLGEALTAVKGPLDSLCKRHGHLLEEALAHGLAAQDDRFEVSTQVCVPISRAAQDLIAANPKKALEGLNLPTRDDSGRRVVIDIVAFDVELEKLHVISVKRGGGAQGGKAAREERNDLVAAGLLLKHLMLRKGVGVRDVEPILVDWYGRSRIVARKTVSRETIDAYFGVPLAPVVDAMSARLSAGLEARMASRLKAALALSGDEDRVQVSDLKARLAKMKDPAVGAGRARASLASCLAEIPHRPRGRQMRNVTA